MSQAKALLDLYIQYQSDPSGLEANLIYARDAYEHEIIDTSQKDFYKDYRIVDSRPYVHRDGYKAYTRESGQLAICRYVSDKDNTGHTELFHIYRNSAGWHFLLVAGIEILN